MDNPHKLTRAQNHILQVVMQNSPIRPDELLDHPEVQIGRIMLQRHLKKLCEFGYLEKEGQVPRVFYSAVTETSQESGLISRFLKTVVHASSLTKQIYQSVRTF